ncbi:MAG: exodeoxyribonuclease VII small subunit [Brevibacterium yomogidense]|uniref:Exodeoxyribonuclease 7 small subunit n=2 Tax=Brevibacterium TaxID=1696 RepID=A0A2H1L612_9MICO|nr:MULTISPECIES: exodeoxyribonuclease VII small subunit [Brevibacterium]TWC03524.1 exodeoxyribonuclease VII small subunit [Brevibacterium jeotgali]SLM93059.1 Exodeoxyribonuclease VII small subunit [Brevibacterium yomogidense]SMX85691.1 Exodeoxyribonuclease VII small subunit [Brevibacterium sp. Mu109]SMY12346.1 Exodeoxyribonuclease VII small subunit [Brevibacterium jeotgali]
MADEQNSTTTVPGGATDGIDALSYEQAREELVTTVRTLEAGSLTLEESLRLWERGEALADRCQNWLDGAKDRLEKARAARDEQDGAAQG